MKSRSRIFSAETTKDCTRYADPAKKTSIDGCLCTLQVVRPHRSFFSSAASFRWRYSSKYEVNMFIYFFLGRVSEPTKNNTATTVDNVKYAEDRYCSKPGLKLAIGISPTWCQLFALTSAAPAASSIGTSTAASAIVVCVVLIYYRVVCTVDRSASRVCRAYLFVSSERVFQPEHSTVTEPTYERDRAASSCSRKAKNEGDWNIRGSKWRKLGAFFPPPEGRFAPPLCPMKLWSCLAKTAVIGFPLP